MAAASPLRTHSRPTPSLDERIAGFADRQHGLIRETQLRSLGLTRGGAAKRVQRGALCRRFRGVYSVGHAALSREGHSLAAVFAAGEGAALSHLSLAELHGVSRFRSPMIHVVAPRRRSLAGVRVHRYRSIDPRDLSTHRGIPVTTVHRLFVDLSDVLTRYQLANVLHEAAFRGRFVEAAVRDAMARANGRRNLDVLEAAIALHKSGSAGTRSNGEDAFIALIEDVLAEPLVNTAFLGFEVDFRWPQERLIVEVDGGGHGRPPNRLIDTGRDEALREAGYTVLRFSDDDVFTRAGEVRRRTVAATVSSRGSPRAA